MAAAEENLTAGDRRTAPPGAPAAVPGTGPALAPWSQALTCYSAALAAWLAVRDPRWWRPLLAGGPTLGTSPADGGLFLFHHHSAPLLPSLGLAVRWTDRWSRARESQREQLARHGAVTVCGDAYRLPWQVAHGRRHGPHWFTVVRGPEGDAVADALAMTTQDGPQQPCRVPLDDALPEEWCRALPGDGDPVHWLREDSVSGTSHTGRGARYRWLTWDGDAPAPAADPGMQPGPGRARCAPEFGAAAVRALAERVRTDGPLALHRQADDLWQALRQRELLLTAAGQDEGLLDQDGLAHWQRATAVWRRLPRILLRSRLRADSALDTPAPGTPPGPGAAADTALLGALTALAAYEGRHPVPAPAARTSTARNPVSAAHGKLP